MSDVEQPTSERTLLVSDYMLCTLTENYLRSRFEDLGKLMIVQTQQARTCS